MHGWKGTGNLKGHGTVGMTVVGRFLLALAPTGKSRTTSTGATTEVPGRAVTGLKVVVRTAIDNNKARGRAAASADRSRMDRDSGI
jgi:hypothetical protein